MTTLQLPWYLNKDYNNIEVAWARTQGQGASIAFYDYCIDKDHEGLQNKILNPSGAQQPSIGTCPATGDNKAGTIHAGTIAASFGEYTCTPAPCSLRVTGVSSLSQIKALGTNSFPPTSPALPAPGNNIYAIRLNTQLTFINFADSSLAQWPNTKFTSSSTFNCDKLQDDNILIIASAAYKKEHIFDKGQSKKIPTILTNLKVNNNDNECRKYLVSIGSTEFYNQDNINNKNIPKFAGIAYGEKYTDIYAPGEKVPVLIPKDSEDVNAQETDSSTSSPAASIVAGAVALMSSIRPTAKATTIRDALLRYSRTITKDSKTLIDIVSPGLEMSLPNGLMSTTNPDTPAILQNQLQQISQLSFPLYKEKAKAQFFPQNYIPTPLYLGSFATPPKKNEQEALARDAAALQSLNKAMPMALRNILAGAVGALDHLSDKYAAIPDGGITQYLPLALPQALPMLSKVPVADPVFTPYGLTLGARVPYTLDDKIPNHILSPNIPGLIEKSIKSTLPLALESRLQNLAPTKIAAQPAAIATVVPLAVPTSIPSVPPLFASTLPNSIDPNWSNLPIGPLVPRAITGTLAKTKLESPPENIVLLDVGNVVKKFAKTIRANSERPDVQDFYDFPSIDASGKIEYTGCLYRDCTPLSELKKATVDALSDNEKKFYAKHYICNDAHNKDASNNDRIDLFKVIQKFYNDLYVTYKSNTQIEYAANDYSFIFSNPVSLFREAFFCTDKGLFSNFYDDPTTIVLADADLRNQFKSLHQNYVSSKFYYHFIEGGKIGDEWCAANPSEYSYSRNYQSESETVYEIYLCPKVITDITSATLRKLPIPGTGIGAPVITPSTSLGKSVYWIIAREVAYLLDFSNFRNYKDTEMKDAGISSHSVRDCMVAADTCTPLDKRVILGDCFGFYMELFSLLTTQDPAHIAVVNNNEIGSVRGVMSSDPSGAVVVDPRIAKLEVQMLNIKNMLTKLRGLNYADLQMKESLFNIYSTYIYNDRKCADQAALTPPMALQPQEVWDTKVKPSLNKMLNRINNKVSFYIDDFCATSLKEQSGYSYGTGGGGAYAPISEDLVKRVDILRIVDKKFESFDQQNVLNDPILLCSRLFYREIPQNIEDTSLLFSTLSHELTHASYAARDRTYQLKNKPGVPDTCENWANNCNAEEFETPFLIPACMQAFFNQYFIEECMMGGCP